MAAQFLQTLISVSEKAANIARVIRSDQRLFQMLIEEKTSFHKNDRFVQDFKTLADVLIQETIKHDLGKQFPSLVDKIKGEECNTFTNTVGESICVEIKNSEQDTCDLLVRVLGGDSTAAEVLAHTVHTSADVGVLTSEEIEKLVSFEFNGNDIGIWIDPIDGTSEYIRGRQNASLVNNIRPNGMECCTVLIGAYKLENGSPVLSIINQPFHSFDSSSKSWKGKIYWGASSPEYNISSIGVPKDKELQMTIVISSHESQALKDHLKKSGFIVLYGAGAGYKLLCVALGLADTYILSQGSTFRWDTCAPHCLIRAGGGDIVNYQRAVKQNEFEVLNYHKENDGASGYKAWCNQNGLIAYKDGATLNKVLKSLQKFNL